MKKSIVRVLALVLMLTLVITSSAAALKLQKNDKSDNVRRLQQALTQLGYYSGTVDGSFGSGTKAAVTAFQQANSLTVDGIAGSATIALLEKQTGIDIDGNSSSSSSTAAGLFKGDYSKLQYTSSGSRVHHLQGGRRVRAVHVRGGYGVPEGDRADGGRQGGQEHARQVGKLLRQQWQRHPADDYAQAHRGFGQHRLRRPDPHAPRGHGWAGCAVHAGPSGGAGLPDRHLRRAVRRGDEGGGSCLPEEKRLVR